MTETGNEHYSVTVKLTMHITQLKSWKDSAQQRNLLNTTSQHLKQSVIIKQYNQQYVVPGTEATYADDSRMMASAKDFPDITVSVLLIARQWEWGG